MSAPSKRQRLLTEIAARLAAIREANGFQTEAGALVFLNDMPALGPDDPPGAIVIAVNPDQVNHVAEKVGFILPIEIQAQVHVGQQRPYEVAEAMVADIKQAMELTDRTCGGLTTSRFTRSSTRILPRQDGHDYVGVGVAYWFPMSEQWGNPAK